MIRLKVEDSESLASVIYKKLQCEINPEAPVAAHYIGSDSPSLYNLAWYTPEDATRHYEEVMERFWVSLDELSTRYPKIAGKHHNYMTLPPLFCLSQTKYMIVFDPVILVAQKDGPIIPILSHEVMRETPDVVYDTLCILYQLNDPDYQTLDSLHLLLEKVCQQQHEKEEEEKRRKMEKEERKQFKIMQRELEKLTITQQKQYQHTKNNRNYQQEDFIDPHRRNHISGSGQTFPKQQQQEWTPPPL